MVKFLVDLHTSDQKEVSLRFQVLTFHKRFGTTITTAAYGVSRATIYRWKRRYRLSGEKIISLRPHSRKPHQMRPMEIHPAIITFIKQLREQHRRLGKEKIKPLLDQYCIEQQLPTISISTIGKVIKRYNLTTVSSKRIYHDPASYAARQTRNYKRKVKRSPQPQQSGYVEIDTIQRFIHNIRVYIFNAVDIKMKFQFSYAYTSASSKNAVDFFQKLQLVYPLSSGITTVQTDNGSEYLGMFDEYLKKKQISHLFIYPRCPKINSFVERANRTLSEEFIVDNLPILTDEGIGVFNRKLIDYLVWYNTRRIHQGLHNQTPIDYLLTFHPESHMYVTRTIR